MEEALYRVVRIDGDYALLLPAAQSAAGADPNPVALALLPEGLREGELLVCRFPEYERPD